MKGRHKNWLKIPHHLLDLALVAALACTMAWWTWALAAPAAVAASHAAPAAPSEEDLARARTLFGAARAAPAANGALRLVGVASPGAAVFARQGGKPAAARPGDEVVPGTLLREVHEDHVLVERNGVLERLALERRSQGRDAGR